MGGRGAGELAPLSRLSEDDMRMGTIRIGNREVYVVALHPKMYRDLQLTPRERWLIHHRSRRIALTREYGPTRRGGGRATTAQAAGSDPSR